MRPENACHYASMSREGGSSHERKANLGATGSIRVGRVTLRANLWVTWLDIAFERRRTAERAREAADTAAGLGEEYAEFLGDEMRASMVAVSASAHAIDAFYGAVDQLAELPDELREAWKENRTKRAGRILETIKRAFKVGPRAANWSDDLVWLFDLRDAAVHHEPADHESVPHPGGYTNVGRESLNYSAETAARATEVALDLITGSIESPFPEQQDIANWAGSIAHVPDALRDFARR